ncbi:hypothetical protein GCM10007880_61580 [Mesorhizobium amorphae]|nr:hypothetical protein GCM10007880_61580 [Mesorhizobium amorphae]
MRWTSTAAVITMAATILSGCETTSPQVAALQDNNTCRMYGIKPGTQLFITCMMQQSGQREQRRAAQNQAIATAFVGAAVVGVAAAAASSGPYYRPYYRCGYYRCWY